MIENYPLLCGFCGNRFNLSDVPMYLINIDRIYFKQKENEEGDIYPHQCEFVRTIQICDACLKNSDIQAALEKSNRQIE